MKEKETVTVVCSHCGQPIQSPQQWLFREQWELGWHEQARYFGFYADIINPGEDRVYVIGVGERTKPMALRKWEKANPCPKIDQQVFIVTLANRVLALEAALAEKGGAK